MTNNTTISMEFEDLVQTVIDAGAIKEVEHCTSREALYKALENHKRSLEVRLNRSITLNQAAIEDVEAYVEAEDRGIALNTGSVVDPQDYEWGFGDKFAPLGML